METPPSRVAPEGNHKIWSILSHLSSFLGVGFILPLVIYLSMKNESEYVRSNAREALNFHISVLIYLLCCVPLMFIVIGVPIAILLGIGSLILSIVAAVRAADGETYHYPFTIRFVK